MQHVWILEYNEYNGIGSLMEAYDTEELARNALDAIKSKSWRKTDSNYETSVEAWDENGERAIVLHKAERKKSNAS